MAAPSMSSISNPPNLPAFLKQSRSDIHNKFIDLEWQQRNRLLLGTQSPTDSSNPSQFSRLSPDIAGARNRYLNVEPYASNRIKLKVKEGLNDYINASPIVLGKRKYIATQGPKDTGVNHFYRMLVSEVETPAVVVMLTQTHEAGREKCFQYYPLSPEESPLQIPPDEEEAENGCQGEVQLESLETDDASRSEVRRMRLRAGREGDEAQELEIRHLLFSGWPDFLIPEGEDKTALVELVQLSAALNRPNEGEPQTNGATAATAATRSLANDLLNTSSSNPRIIHCSAGVGRSGTFIALDYLLSLLHSNELDSIEDDKDPVVDIVDEMRQQRMMMVQGESQFNFLYEVLKEQMVVRMQGQASGGAEAGS